MNFGRPFGTKNVQTPVQVEDLRYGRSKIRATAFRRCASITINASAFLLCKFLWSAFFLPLPATQEWGEDRGGVSNVPPLPVPLLHPMEEREFLCFRQRRVAKPV